MTSPQRSEWAVDLLNYFSLTIMPNYYQLPAWAPSEWRLRARVTMRLSFLKSSAIICLSKALLRENTLTKSTFFKIIFELLLAPPLFCLIRGCSRHWVGKLCLGFHRGIRVWSRFSLCLSFVTCVTWNTQAAGQLGNLKSHFKNCKTDEYYRSALLVLRGFCRWWLWKQF